MASRMIGRAKCPECGFDGAHVKESEKCTYRYCPECGAQHHARTPRQVADLVAKMRPIEGAPAVPTPTPSPTLGNTPAPTAAEPNPTATPAKRGRLFG